MALLIRHECFSCGKTRDNGAGEPWVRCSHCDTLLGFDWTAWFETQEYAASLKNAARTAKEWQVYQALLEKADARIAAGNLAGAKKHIEDAIAKQFELSPFLFPPEARVDRAYLERHVALMAWYQLQVRIDPELKTLWDAFQKECRSFDMRDPLPMLERASELLERQQKRLFQLGPPEDPDGMPPPIRMKVWRTHFLGAYLHVLSPEHRIELLRKLYGRENVRSTGDSDVDEGGLFLEWTCPRCALRSLQVRAATQYVCQGCHLIADAADEQLPAIDTRCANCGAELRLEAGALDVRCSYCDALTRRHARSTTLEREWSREVSERIHSEAGLTLPTYSSPSYPPLDPHEQLAARLQGLVRQAQAWASVVTPRRFASLVRGSFSDHSPEQQADLLERAIRLAQSEKAGEAAIGCLTAAKAALASERT